MPPHANSKIILLKICYNFNFLVFFKFDFLWNLFFQITTGGWGHSKKNHFRTFRYQKKSKKETILVLRSCCEDAKFFNFLIIFFIYKSPDLLELMRHPRISSGPLTVLIQQVRGIPETSWHNRDKKRAPHILRRVAHNRIRIRKLAPHIRYLER